MWSLQLAGAGRSARSLGEVMGLGKWQRSRMDYLKYIYISSVSSDMTTFHTTGFYKITYWKGGKGEFGN